jgi:UDP-glucuronate 4-epimerase
MQVLVTGAAGFIGFHLSRALLARGDSVIGVDDCNDYYDPALKEARLAVLRKEGAGRFHFIEHDIADTAGLTAALAPHRFERIVHLAAQAGVRYSLQNPHAYVQSNLVGHVNLLEIARQREVAHMVYASSSSVYGGNAKVPFAVEDRVDHPVSLYAATKRSDELMSETYAHLYRIPLTGLRFFTVYGPWGRPDMMLWIFTRLLFAGEALPVFNHGDMYRDFTFIEDIVAGVLASLDNPPPDDGAEKAGGSKAPHRLYNIGNHRSEHLMKVIDLLGEATGIAPVLDLQPMQPGDVPRTYADIEAISADLGYQPTTSIEEGVPQFVNWYKDYHRL